MDNKTKANELLSSELNETVGELISSGVFTTTLGPLAAGVLGVMFGVGKDLFRKVQSYRKANDKDSTPLERVRHKLSNEIEEDSKYYKSVLTRLAMSQSLKELNNISLELSKHLKLDKEEYVALHEYLFSQRRKFHELHLLTDH
jgi:hypothetical protein